ncbi:MAG: hypothetical protein B7Z74_02390 [Deltaproteobacteria bacterium 21-66-5]|nr:MAG: hypothetical protein B7Z74_02390 [Deltaproteobacteria bacterium 21-66-5]
MRVNPKRILYPESAAVLAAAGALFGALAVGLAVLGNPPSTGLCASCFLVNVAGALGLHAGESQSYLRPEILGVVLGAFIGCPIKALLRTAGGGAAGLVGLAGLVSGVLFATAYLRDGFSLPAPRALPEGAGLVLPAAAFLLLALSAGIGESFAGSVFPSGARHAPFAASAAAGILFGAVGQRTRFCVTGSVRTAALARDFREAAGTGAFLLAALAVNLYLGTFTPTLSLEPGAHTDLLATSTPPPPWRGCCWPPAYPSAGGSAPPRRA